MAQIVQEELGFGDWGLGIGEGGALRAQFNMGLRRSFRMDMISL